MSWLKVDDQFSDHPKVLALGRDRLAGIGLWMIGTCYAGRFLTDGYIPATALPAGSRRLALRMVEVGLWDAADGGYRIHDYLDYQPNRADALAVRQARAEAGRRGGQANPKQTGKQTRSKPEANGQAVASGVSEANGNPVPVPVLTTPDTPLPPNDADDLEVLADGLLLHAATPGQLRAIRTLSRKVGQERTVEVMRSWMTREVDDRFGGVLDQLGTEASTKGKASRSPFAYMDAES